MNPDVLKSMATSIVAILLSTAGGYLVGQGYVTSADWGTISAGLLAAVGVVAYKAAQHTVGASVDKVRAAGGIANAPSAQ